MALAVLPAPDGPSPVFDLEAHEPLEILGVRGHQHEIVRLGDRGNLPIDVGGRLAQRLQACTLPAVPRGRFVACSADSVTAPPRSFSN